MSELFQRTLVVAPHCDDESLGCGGLLWKYRRNERRVVVCASGGPKDKDLHRAGELKAAMGCLEVTSYRMLAYTDTKLDRWFPEMVHELDGEIADFQPTALLFPR